MAAGKDKHKPVHPWDLPAEAEADEDLDDAGPKTIIAIEPGPLELPAKGEALESMMPEPDPLGGPTTLPGNAREAPDAGEPEPVAPPPLTAFDVQPAFDPPTNADRPSARQSRPGPKATEPNPVPLAAVPEAVPDSTQPGSTLPPRAPASTAPTVGTPVRRSTGDLGRSAEALRKQPPSGPSAPRRTTGEIKSAELARKSTGDIRSAAAVRKATGEIGSAQAARKAATSKPSRAAALADRDETTRKKLGDQETMILEDLDLDPGLLKKGPQKPAPPLPGLGDGDPDDPEADESTARRPAPNVPGAFSRRRQGEKDPTAPDAQLGDPDLYEATKTGVKPQDPVARRRLMRVVLVAALLCGAVLLVGLYQATRERPMLEELRACYPYGFEGARGPHGEDAPGAEYVEYEHLGEVECASHPVCLRYRYTGLNGFTGTMVVGKALAGSWERVGDDGCPFPPPRSKEQ